MKQLAATCEAIGATPRKTEKVRLLAEYIRSQTVATAAASAIFLSGRPFSAYEETTLRVGGALLALVIVEVSGSRESLLMRAYRKRGDLGAAAFDLLSANRRESGEPSQDQVAASDNREAPVGNLTVLDVMAVFHEIASARGPALKADLLRRLLSRATPLDAKYIIKIITGDLRIGLKESLVEESIAAAYGCPVGDVQRANMLLGDIGQSLRLASEHRLAEARMRLFHPLGFMLASPAESAADAFSCFHHALVENKYDGIRAQAHISPRQAQEPTPWVRIFSRTLDEISGSFPELVAPLAGFREDAILDGEILAWDFTRGCALPFHRLQQRLGRKRPTAALMREIPVAYVAFDVLYAGSELVIDRPLRERAAVLDRLFRERLEPAIAADSDLHSEAQRVLPFASNDADLDDSLHTNLEGQGTRGHPAFSRAFAKGWEKSAPGAGSTANADHEPAERASIKNSAVQPILHAPGQRADSAEHLAEIFEAALTGGDEGLMIKDIESPYRPGRRGRSWLKLKRELATLDVAVTSVEWGHGRRINVLSDYTFAVRKSQQPDRPQNELLNVGKAYSGLTDQEIATLTDYFLAHTTTDHGFWREVEPKLVIEVAFNGIMRSDRHNSGYALRFPRILRLRPDKTPEDIDTIARVKEIYDSQKFQKSA
jgi:DNA ligase 1